MKRRDFFKRIVNTCIAGVLGVKVVEEVKSITIWKPAFLQPTTYPDIALDEFAKAGLQGAKAGRELGMYFKNGRILF